MSGIAPEPTAGRPSPWRWWVCGLLLTATTINYLDRVALNQTASDIKAAFALSNTDYSRLESGFVLAFGAGAITFGTLADRVGVRWLYPLAILGWSAAGFLTGFAPSYLALLACRVGLGLFEAGNWPCGIRTVRQVMPPAERSLGCAIFQSGTGLGATLTPLIVAACLAWAGPSHPNPWQIPFRVIGLIGVWWAVLWLLTVPARVVDPANAVRGDVEHEADREPFYRVFFGRKFWLLVLLVDGVNTTWHTFRVWLPLYLETQLGYTPAEMRRFSTAYFLTTDVGAWTAGLTTLALVRSRLGLFQSRLITFAIGVGLVLTSGLIPFISREAAQVVIFVTGFGALGLFANYFALSQEVSARHQGKVTGSLGVLNSLYLAVVYEIEGQANDALRNRYDWVLSVAGVPALVALVAVYLFWPRK